MNKMEESDVTSCVCVCVSIPTAPAPVAEATRSSEMLLPNYKKKHCRRQQSSITNGQGFLHGVRT